MHKKMIKDVQWQHHNDTFKNGLRLAFMNNSFIAGKHKNLLLFINELILLIDEEIKK